MKKLLSTNEFVVAATIAVLSIVIGSMNGVFLTVGNFIDLFKNSIVMGIFSLGVLLVIISGGIDVSFPVIASFSMYSTVKLLNYFNFQGSVIVAFLIAGLIGLLLGLINAVFISNFNLPTLIVTLGTSSMYGGFLLAFIGVKEISNIPKGMDSFSKVNIYTTANGGVTSALPASIVIFAVLIIFVWFLLKYTMLGRGIYSLGGDDTSARRAGFNITKIKYFIYSFVGLISGIAGIVHACLMRNSNPVDLIGTELIVIAAVVLGGARITGGYGSVLGTVLGLFLVTVINNSLILLGIPSYYQRFVVGLLILIGIGVTSYQAKKSKNESNIVFIE